MHNQSFFQSGDRLSVYREFSAQCFVDWKMACTDFPVVMTPGMAVIHCGPSPYSDFILRLTPESKLKFGKEFFAGHEWILEAPDNCYAIEVKHIRPHEILIAAP